MKQRLIHLFLFSGFLSVIQCGPYEYILIQENKTWDEAQAYCREIYSDLATVESEEDRSELRNLGANQTWMWIGLYYDVNSWSGSFNSEPPNRSGGNYICGYLDPDGHLYGQDCETRCAFICQSKETEKSTFVPVIDPVMSWSKAQNYCRENSTDLVTVMSDEENQQLLSMIQNFTCAWTGVFRDSWKWSDQTWPTSSNVGWMTEEPKRFFGNKSCAAANGDGQIVDMDCSNQLYFFCHNLHIKQQLLRLEVKAGNDVNDQAVKSAVLQQIQQKLREQGMGADVKMRWRVQNNSMVFQRMKNQPPENNEAL